jgi:hypothetical protein
MKHYVIPVWKVRLGIVAAVCFYIVSRADAGFDPSSLHRVQGGDWRIGVALSVIFVVALFTEWKVIKS